MMLAVVLGLGSRGFAAPNGSVTITGAEQSSAGVWDAGTTTATINSISVSVSYGQYSTPASVASALAAKISENCNMPVFAHAVDAVINFYAKNSRSPTA